MNPAVQPARQQALTMEPVWEEPEWEEPEWDCRSPSNDPLCSPPVSLAGRVCAVVVLAAIIRISSSGKQTDDETSEPSACRV